MERTWAEVGDIARRRRESLGYTQDDVVNRAAERSGKRILSTANLRIFERGGRDNYRPSTLIGIARGLDWDDYALTRIKEGAAANELSRSPNVQVGDSPEMVRLQETADLAEDAFGNPTEYERLMAEVMRLQDLVQKLLDRQEGGAQSSAEGAPPPPPSPA